MAMNAKIAALRAASPNVSQAASGPQALDMPWAKVAGSELAMPDRAPINQQAWRDSLRQSQATPGATPVWHPPSFNRFGPAGGQTANPPQGGSNNGLFGNLLPRVRDNAALQPAAPALSPMDAFRNRIAPTAPARPAPALISGKFMANSPVAQPVAPAPIVPAPDAYNSFNFRMTPPEDGNQPMFEDQIDPSQLEMLMRMYTYNQP
jgi:hypothetical protein